MPEIFMAVADRELQSGVWKIRRHIGEHEGAGFARWLADPSLGRFLVIVPAESAEERYINVLDEAELVSLFSEMCSAAMKNRTIDDPRIEMNLSLEVATETLAKIENVSKQYGLRFNSSL
jgi:hypothetical protein